MHISVSKDYIYYILSAAILLYFVIFWAPNPKFESYPVLILLLFIIFFLTMNNPVYGFMIAYTVFLDIGNYYGKNTFGLPNFFQFRDVALIMCFLVVILSNKLSIRALWRDRNLRILLRVLIIFTLYQIFVTVYFHLNPSPIDFLKQIVYHRWRFFGIFFIIPTYIIMRQALQWCRT